jgi:predicted small secreted protein
VQDRTANLGGNFAMKIIHLGLVAALALLAACNTIEGAGRDLKSVGSAVAKSADAAKDD